MISAPEVHRLASLYQLGLPRLPPAGRAGELLGRGAGSSLEFQEYREYAPGDDVRHIDWAAYARTDALMIRMYRDEISPRTEIVLDASRSMAAGGEHRPQMARQLAELLVLLSGRTGGRPAVLPAADDPPAAPWEADPLERLDRLQFDGRGDLPELLEAGRIPLRRQSVRIVISDFLFRYDPEQLIRRLSAEATALWIIQILTRWESDPSPLGGRRLIDAESRSEIDLIVNDRAIAAYRERLARLQDELTRSCRRAAAAFVTLIAEDGLEAACRQELCTSGILRPV